MKYTDVISPDQQEPSHSLDGTKWPCQHCESSFTLRENRPNGKRSRSWASGWSVWGTTTPQRAKTFFIKCPNCGNLAGSIIVGAREPSPWKELEPKKPEILAATVVPFKKPSDG
jgi:hypothetical protein